MPDDLYRRDALAWSERQADLLRRLAAGERVNDAVDWPNVIEEVGDVGLSELRACQSLLVQGIAHLLKLHGCPRHRSAAHWRGEASVFLDDARRRFTPSMRQRIALADLYATAARSAAAVVADLRDARAWPDFCPFALDALLDGDIAALLAMIGGNPAG